MPTPTIAWRTNLHLSALAGGVLLATVAWLVTPDMPGPVLQFVAEHGNIAAALLHGRGFADAFGTLSGPTAWEPPVFPCYLAAVFAVFGVKTLAAAWALLVGDAVLVSATVLCTVSALDLAGRSRLKAGFTLALVLLTWVHEWALGPWLTTGWFVSALDAAFLLGVMGALTEGRRAWWCLMGVTASLAVLTHAGSGAACLAITVALWIALAVRLARHGGGTLRRALVSSAARPLAVLAACLVSAGLWTARNWVVFHEVIPLKSNGFFEVVLAESGSADGVIDDAVIVMGQPLSNPRLLVDYTVRGEVSFLAPYGPLAHALLDADPGRFVRHVGRRALSVFSYCDTAPRIYQCRASLSRTDGARLVGAGLAARFTSPLPVWWTSLGLSPEEFEARLAGLQVADPRGLTRDWLNAKVAMLGGETLPSHVLSGFALAGLPTACLLGMLALKRRRLDAHTAVCALFYGFAVLPNVLITHYATHQLHFLWLHALFITGFFGTLGGRISRRGHGPAEGLC